jgi:FkbM family methyltransferase
MHWFGKKGGNPQHDQRATEADIRACFRLLLGRAPNPEEWRGHSMRVGEDLAGVVASYVNSLEFHRRGLLRRDKPARIGISDLPGFRIFTDADDAAVGRYVRDDNYEPAVTQVVRGLLAPGMGVLDLGANIGYFTMLAASIVGPSGFVMAVEPNPRNAKLLEASRRANGFDQVVVCQVAAGPEPGLLVLHTSHSNGTTSSLPSDEDALLLAETVACARPDSLLPPERRIDLIKVDVEGAEYRALLGCRATIHDHRPVIVTEFSPDLMPGISGIDGEFYLGWLQEQGYHLSIIEPDATLRPVSSITAVMAAYVAQETDHLDLVARADRCGS